MPSFSLSLARRMALMKALRAKYRAYKKPSMALAKTGKAVGYYKGGSVPSAPVEVKFKSTAFPAAAIPAGVATLIDSTIVADIVNGTGPSDRIGRRIKIVKIDYSYSLTFNRAAATFNTDAVRYDIWLDKQSNGIGPGQYDLYEDLSAARVPGTCMLPNLYNEKRFRRLYTKVQQVNSQNFSGAQVCNVGVKFEGSIYPNVVIEYDATTGNIADLTSNNILQCWSSDSGLFSVRTCVTRVHYTDA